MRGAPLLGASAESCFVRNGTISAQHGATVGGAVAMDIYWRCVNWQPCKKVHYCWPAVILSAIGGDDHVMTNPPPPPTVRPELFPWPARIKRIAAACNAFARHSLPSVEVEAAVRASLCLRPGNSPLTPTQLHLQPCFCLGNVRQRGSRVRSRLWWLWRGVEPGL